MRLKLGSTKPKQPIFGFDLVGQVEVAGTAVTRCTAGRSGWSPRGGVVFGCAAAYVTVVDREVRHGPGTCYQAAVPLGFGGTTALIVSDRVELATGERARRRRLRCGRHHGLNRGSLGNLAKHLSAPR